MSTTGNAPSAGGWTPRLALSTFVMIMIYEATALGFTVVSTALPVVSKEFQTTQGGWLITGFILGGAISCPVVAKLADLYGKRHVMACCLMVGLLGAILATAAPTFGVLIAGRSLQGVVIAAAFLTYSLMRDVFPIKILPMASALSMTGIGFFSIGAPFLIGWLLDSFGWRVLFGLDVVWIAILAPLLIATTRESPVRYRSRIDWLGALLFGFGLSIVLAGVSLGSTWGWLTFRTLGCILLGLLLLGGFALRSLTVFEPIVNLRMVAGRAILLVVVTSVASQSMAGVYASMSAIIAQTPRAAGGDYGLGLTALQYGLLSAPQALFMVLGGLVVGRMTNRWGGAALMNVGMVVMIGAAVLIGFANGTYAGMLAGGVVFGFAMGLTFGAVPSLVMSATTPENQASIAGMVQVCYNTGGAVTPVILFVLLGNYVAFSADGFVVYSAAGFATGGIFMIVVLVVALVLALTVLRRRRDQSMITEDVQAVPVGAVAGDPTGPGAR